jgi:hypothetical protein
MDPAVRELAELVGRVLAERWLKRQKEEKNNGKRTCRPSRSTRKRTTKQGIPAECEIDS